MDAPNDNYLLPPNSPAIDTGTGTDVPKIDIDGDSGPLDISNSGVRAS